MYFAKYKSVYFLLACSVVHSVHIILQYSANLSFVDECFNATMVQATDGNKEVFIYIYIYIYICSM